jgi:hypothetical protein
VPREVHARSRRRDTPSLPLGAANTDIELAAVDLGDLAVGV